MNSAGKYASLRQNPSLPTRHDYSGIVRYGFGYRLCIGGFSRYMLEYIRNGSKMRRVNDVSCRSAIRGFKKNMASRNHFIGDGKNVQKDDHFDISLTAFMGGVIDTREQVFGSDSMVAPGVEILTIGHHYDRISSSTDTQRFSRSNVIVEDNALIGLRVIRVSGTKEDECILCQTNSNSEKMPNVSE